MTRLDASIRASRGSHADAPLRGDARGRVAVRRRVILVMPEGERPQPRLVHSACGGGLPACVFAAAQRPRLDRLRDTSVEARARNLCRKSYDTEQPSGTLTKLPV